MTSGAPLRIMLVEVAYREFGADYRVHSQLVAALAASDQAVVTSLSHPDLARLQPDAIERRMIALSHPGTRLQHRLSVITDLPRVLRRSLREVRRFRPDVIYSGQARKDVLLAGLISRFAGVPQIVHLHYSFGPWLGRLAAAITRRADHVVAVSEFVRQTMLLRGVPEDRVTTLPNLTAAPEQTTNRTAVRQDLGISPNDIVVIAVGRLDHGKGFGELIGATKILASSHERLRVLVCGASNHSAGHDAELRRKSSELGLDKVITFLGQRSDIPALLAAADVFCLPSRMEPFGLVFIEAMRAGLPVVALLSGGVPEIVVDGVTGLLSYPGDNQALAANLRTLIDDAETRARMGRAGRERLASHFDHATIACRWIETVRRVADRPEQDD